MWWSEQVAATLTVWYQFIIYTNLANSPLKTFYPLVCICNLSGISYPSSSYFWFWQKRHAFRSKIVSFFNRFSCFAEILFSNWNYCLTFNGHWYIFWFCSRIDYAKFIPTNAHYFNSRLIVFSFDFSYVFQIYTKENCFRTAPNCEIASRCFKIINYYRHAKNT